MGKQTAEALTEMETGLEAQLLIHLRNNHYPPAPSYMVAVAKKAIEIYNETQKGDELIELPNGVTYRGSETVSVFGVIEAFHLDPWCDSDDY